MNHFCSPLRYPGGKNCIYSFVSNLFYENDLVGIDYAEPFAGGSGLALRLLFNEYVSNIYINDLDTAIFYFWKAVLERNTDLCNWIEEVEVNVNSWNYYKKVQLNKENYDYFEIAKSTFFLNRTNVSGVIKGGIIGGFEQKGKYKIDARFNKNQLIDRFKRINNFRHRIHLSNLNGKDFIKNIDSKKTPSFIYIDPPYYVKGADLYMNFFKENDHKQLANEIHKIKNKWMTSYDYNEFILNLYKEQSKFIYTLSQNTSNRIGNELIIFSKDLNYKESIYKLNSPISI